MLLTTWLRPSFTLLGAEASASTPVFGLYVGALADLAVVVCAVRQPASKPPTPLTLTFLSELIWATPPAIP